LENECPPWIQLGSSRYQTALKSFSPNAMPTAIGPASYPPPPSPPRRPSPLALVGKNSAFTKITERSLAKNHLLADHQNADGGWGDTIQSLSNISTMLCRRPSI
jgi:hypothetical protein